MTADQYFYDLDALAEPVPEAPAVSHVGLDGKLLRLERWERTGTDAVEVSIDGVMEAFVLPLDGPVRVLDTRTGETTEVHDGAVALLPEADAGRYRLAIDRRCVVASMPTRTGIERGDGPDEPTSFVLEEELEHKYEGWKFYALDGRFLTVGCSYRTAPPPSQETPHTHPGEQFNVALEGLFEMTIGGITHEIERGWVSHVPPETLHTGLHKRFPYFQLIFSTPPRGSDYGAFLAGIYQAEIEA